MGVCVGSWASCEPVKVVEGSGAEHWDEGGVKVQAVTRSGDSLAMLQHLIECERGEGCRISG